MIAYLGLDVCQDNVVASFLCADGSEPVNRWEVKNDLPGATALAERVAELCRQFNVDDLRIGIESTGLLWWHLACLLADSSVLESCHPKVYVLNPQRVHAWRDTMGPRYRSDWYDPFVIADYIRMGRDLPSPFKIDLTYAPLQRLTRFRFHLAHTLAREKTYFLTFLFLPFSAFGQAEPFGNTFGTTSLDILEGYSTEDLVKADLETLATTLQQKGRGRFQDPQDLAKTLQRLARDSYRMNKVLDEPLRLIQGNTIATIRTLQAQIKTVDTTIARELKAISQPLSSVPGLGPVWIAGLISEIGDISRFPNDAALASYAGLVWDTNESGDFQADETPLSQRGNAYLRYYLVEGANSVRVHCPEYQDYYQAKYDQTPKHAHKRALVLTGRKLVRLVFTLLHNGQLYRPPEERTPRKDATAPHSARPGRQRHHRRAPAVG